MASDRPLPLEGQEALERYRAYRSARNNPDPAALYDALKSLLDSVGGNAALQAQEEMMRAYDSLSASPTAADITQAEMDAWRNMGRTVREAVTLDATPAEDAPI